MLESRDKAAILQLGLQSEALEPDRSADENGPILLTPQDIVDLVASFEDLIYHTAVYKFGGSNVTATIRQQYALVLTDVQISSVFFFFKPANDANAQQLTQVIDDTLAWLKRVFDSLSLDDVDDALTIMNLTMATLGFPHGLSQSQAWNLLQLVVRYLKVSERHNRRPIMASPSIELTPSKRTIERTSKLAEDLQGRIDRGRRLRKYANDESDLTQADVNLPPGTITRMNRSKHEIVLYIERFGEPIPCKYDPLEHRELGQLTEGDVISVSGRGYFWRGEEPNGTPRLIKINDYTRVNHSYSAHYKL